MRSRYSISKNAKLSIGFLRLFSQQGSRAPGISVENVNARSLNPFIKMILAIMQVSVLSIHSHATSITYVTIGDPGNPPDESGKGSVSYNYAISQTEIPIIEYVNFLNAVAASDPNELWSSSIKYIARSGADGNYHYSTELIWENKPVVANITKILRFINWLHNDRPFGSQTSLTTEDGAYTFYGKTSYTLRNANAKYWMPNENEWRKAAYYDPITKTHRIYPHGSDDPVTAVGDANGDIVNPSNKTYAYGQRNWGDNISAPFSVGTSGSHSPWGTLDQAGNEWEIFEPTQPGQTQFRLYGGAYSLPESNKSVLKRTSTGVSYTGPGYFGIRVAKLIDGNVDWETADDDGDGVSNYNEMMLGTNPSISNQQLFNNIKANPEILSLYSEADIINFEIRGVSCRIEDSNVQIMTSVFESEDLTQWTKSGEMLLELPVDSDFKFYRLTVEK